LDESIKAFVVLDMISYYKKIKGIIIEGADKKPQQSEVLDRIARCAETYTNLRFVISTDYGGSDHEPFLDNAMAGALFIEADWGKYRHYHTKKDLPAYQNPSFGLEVVKLAAALLAQEAGVLPAQ
jgi:Zn-dependent M28 family amino/carboxypeptidase